MNVYRVLYVDNLSNRLLVEVKANSIDEARYIINSEHEECVDIISVVVVGAA